MAVSRGCRAFPAPGALVPLSLCVLPFVACEKPQGFVSIRLRHRQYLIRFDRLPDRVVKLRAFEELRPFEDVDRVPDLRRAVRRVLCQPEYRYGFLSSFPRGPKEREIDLC